MRRVVLVVMSAMLAVAVLPLLPATPAGAVSAPFANIAPLDGATPGTNPVFEWQPSAGAVRYVFEIATNPSVSPVIGGGSIATRSTPAV